MARSRKAARELALAAGLALLVAGLGRSFAASRRADDPREPRRFEDSLVVREVEARFDLGVLPRLESIGRRAAEDFALFEDGFRRATLRLDPEPPAGGWEILIWLDDRLAAAPARGAAALALALRAPALTAAGTVTLVEAGATLAARGPIGTASELTTLLVAAARRADEERPGTLSALEPVAAGLRLDRLLLDLAQRGSGPPRALLLPVSAWAADAELLNQLGGARRGDAIATALRPLVEASTGLASCGWVILPLALRPDPAPSSVRGPKPEGDLSTGPGGETRTTFPLFRIPFRPTLPPPAVQARLDTAVDLALVPWSDLARPSSGALVGPVAQLDSTLARLFGRARLVAAGPELTPGRPVAREVRWIGGDGRVLPGLRWATAGTPPEVAAARLRQLRSGLTPPGGAALPLRRGAAPDGGAQLCLAPATPRAWIRFSGLDAAGEPWIGAPLALDRARERECAPIPEGFGGVTLVEELERAVWSAL